MSIARKILRFLHFPSSRNMMKIMCIVRCCFMWPRATRSTPCAITRNFCACFTTCFQNAPQCPNIRTFRLGNVHSTCFSFINLIAFPSLLRHVPIDCSARIKSIVFLLPPPAPMDSNSTKNSLGISEGVESSMEQAVQSPCRLSRVRFVRSAYRPRTCLEWV